MENKLKHLEFIQNVITRMNSNSFFIKGWAITLISVLFALAAKDANIEYMYITLIVIPAFWILDGFYIAQERLYRELYIEVAQTAESEINFSMNASKYSTRRNKWICGVFSKMLSLFYSFIILVSIIVLYLSKVV